jgi:hypothetical protein
MTEPVPVPSLAAVSLSRSAHKPRHWPDVVLGVMVVAFAFLAASFSARNSDLWLHLAAGRGIAGGQSTFGVDPFSYTTGGVYWANHAWLFDLVLYAGFTSLGGWALVAAKAGLVALLAGLMLRIARNDGPFWISAGCVLLAILAASPRLLLRPTVPSLVLLAGCLVLLREGGRALWALPLLVVLWVNVDSWFWLGPLTVVLYGVGERLSPVPHRLPVWLVPACLVACLVSPYHVRGLTLPAELSLGVLRSGLRDDVRFAPLFVSPWRLVPLGSAGGYNLAAWAYFVLMLLGVVSFAVNRSYLRSWRSLVWLTFAALAAWQARLVPFFAVVAGPITALNFAEPLSTSVSLVSAFTGETLVLRIGRLGVAAISLFLIGLAWPGWLQGFYRRDLAVAWRVEPEPSLVRAAHTLSRWRQDGTIPSEVRTFGLHPDVAHYFAWFCPGDKSFFDLRLPLFLGVAADYEQVCLALDPSLSGDAAETSGWETILSQNGIGILVLYDPELGRLAPALQQLTQYPHRWELLRVDGQAVIVAWQGAGIGTPATLAFNPERAAFVHATEALPPVASDEIPTLPEPRSWWQRYLHGYPEPTWEARAGLIYLSLFQDRGGLQLRQQRQRVLARHSAGLAGLPALSSGGVPAIVAMTMRAVFDDLFVPDLMERPPALPLLAIRAARRAIAEQPEQGRAWLVLAEAYLAMRRWTTEAGMHARLPLLSEVRYIQTVTALVQAVTLDAGLSHAHASLALLFAERGYLDLALRHRTAELRLTRREGRLPGEDNDSFTKRIEHLEAVVEDMRREVEDAQNRFAVATASLSGEPLKRAQIALQNGLAGKAIDDVLLRSHPDLYHVEGLRLLLDLLLLTGRARDARDLLDRRELQAKPAGLGMYALPAGHRWAYNLGAFDWCDLCQSAAGGATDRAVAALERLRQPMKTGFGQNLNDLRTNFTLLYTREVGLGAVPAALLPRLIVHAFRADVESRLRQNELLLVEQADLDVLEGMLLLEAGLPARAAARFRRSLPLYSQGEKAGVGLPGRELARRYLDRLGAKSS